MKIIFTLILFCVLATGFSQGILIDTSSNSSPDPSAILEIKSQSKGVLLPRMTALERIEIETPQTGLLVYDLDLNSLFYYDGSEWVEFTSSKRGLRDKDFDTSVRVQTNNDDDTIRFKAANFEIAQFNEAGLNMKDHQNNLFLGNTNHPLYNRDGFNQYIPGLTNGNLSIGIDAGKDLTYTYNTFLGNRAGHNSSFSSRNVYVGYEAGDSTSGSNNTLVGFRAGNGNKAQGILAHSSDNILLGSNVGNFGIGEKNIMIGNNAGEFSDQAKRNIIIGHSSGRFSGNSPSVENIIIGTNNNQYFAGNSNLIIGSLVDDNNFGDHGIVIGNNVRWPSNWPSSVDNRFALDSNTPNGELPLMMGDFNTNYLRVNDKLGINDSPIAELHVTHGNDPDWDGLRLENGTNGQFWRMYVRSSNGNMRLYSQILSDYVAWIDADSGAWNSTSDLRKKKNFESLGNNTLDKIDKLEILKYHFKTQNDTDQKHIGVIAQDLEPYFPEVIHYDKEQDLYTLNYDALSPIALKAIQELIQENNKLKNQIKSIESRLDRLEDGK